MQPQDFLVSDGRGFLRPNCRDHELEQIVFVQRSGASFLFRDHPSVNVTGDDLCHGLSFLGISPLLGWIGALGYIAKQLACLNSRLIRRDGTIAANRHEALWSSGFSILWPVAHQKGLRSDGLD